MSKAKNLIDIINRYNEDLSVNKVDDHQIVLYDKSGDETSEIKDSKSSMPGLADAISKTIKDYCKTNQ